MISEARIAPVGRARRPRSGRRKSPCDGLGGSLTKEGYPEGVLGTSNS